MHDAYIIILYVAWCSIRCMNTGMVWYHHAHLHHMYTALTTRTVHGKPRVGRRVLRIRHDHGVGLVVLGQGRL